MKEVYIVVSGHYEQVCGVFDSKELAQMYIDSFSVEITNDFYIETHQLNINKNFLEKGMKAYKVLLFEDGNVKHCSLSISSYNFTEQHTDDIQENTHYDKIGVYFEYYLYAKDEKEAIEICQKKRNELLKQNNHIIAVKNKGDEFYINFTESVITIEITGYLITSNNFEPLCTNCFNPDNDFKEGIGMVVYDLGNCTYTKDGTTWLNINQDSL